MFHLHRHLMANIGIPDKVDLTSQVGEDPSRVSSPQWGNNLVLFSVQLENWRLAVRDGMGWAGGHRARKLPWSEKPTREASHASQLVRTRETSIELRPLPAKTHPKLSWKKECPYKPPSPPMSESLLLTT